MAVNPELTVANEISRLLLFPDASKIETFVKGRVELIVCAQSRLVGRSLAEMYDRFQVQVLVCAVEHGDEVIIPDGYYVLRPGDRLHITASHAEIERFFKMHGNHKEKIRKVIICGGGSGILPVKTALCPWDADKDHREK